MTSWPNVYIPDGTEQGSRIPSALEANYFNVDEMTPEELLAMGAEFASALRFINFKNEKDGTWADLFLADEAAGEHVAVAGAVLQRDPPLPAGFARGAARVRGERAIRRAGH